MLVAYKRGVSLGYLSILQDKQSISDFKEPINKMLPSHCSFWDIIMEISLLLCTVAAIKFRSPFTLALFAPFKHGSHKEREKRGFSSHVSLCF